MITQKKLIIKAHHQIVCLSDLSRGELPPGIDCFFSPSNGLPLGIRIHAFISGPHVGGKYNIIISNDTHKVIKLPRGFPLGAIYYRYAEGFHLPTCPSTCSQAHTHSHLPTQHISSMTTLNPDTAVPTVDSLFDSVVPPNLNPTVYNDLKTCLNDNSDLFAFTPKQLGTTVLVKHEIELLEPGPIRMRPYPIAYKHKEIIKRHIDDMLAGKIIQHSTSSWAAPVVLADKADNTKRFCVDWRRLNAITRKDSYPLPKIEDLLDSLRGQSLFSTIDLAAGFWQIELAEKSRELTAFVVDHNLYEFLRLPFGLTNSPGTFQRLMNHVLKDVIGKICLVYLDDIIIFASTVEEHVKNLQTVFDLLRAANLKMKLSKCKFLQSKVRYLGHLVDKNGITPDPEKVEAIKNYPRPETVQELQSFIGLASYYRRFIPDFGNISHHLIMQTTTKRVTKSNPENIKPPKPSDKISWGPDELLAFETLKTKLTTEPVLLVHPDFDKEFLIFCDASDFGVGCVLSQLQDDGSEKVVAYASRHLNESERKYPAIEREALAVVFGIKKFRHYLLDNPFTIISDHRPLQWLHTFKDTNGRVGRWSVDLSSMKYTVKYRPGRIHQNADCLSRIRSIQPYVERTDVPLLAERQSEDELCQQIIKYMDDGELSVLNRCYPPVWAKEINLYTMQNGVLCRQHAPPSSKRRRVEQLQAVIPYSLQQEILQEYHDSPQGGHLAYQKTMNRIRDHYYWPDMLKNIHDYCKNCESCAKNRKANPRAKLHPIETPPIPFDTIGIDFLGPIKAHNRGATNHILVITCYFTKWVELIALPNQTAETTAKALMSAIVNRFGMPRVIISDNGPNFASKLFAELCKSVGTKHKFSTPYHPQTSGLTERMNRSLIAILRNYINDGHDNWAEMLEYVAFAYRGSVHASTMESPYYLVHGRDPRMIIDHILQFQPDNPITPIQFAQQNLKRLRIAYQLVRENLRDARVAHKEYYDRRAKIGTFEIGDRVLKDVRVVKKGHSKKFTPKYYGPFRVIEVLSDRTVRILADGKSKSELIHVNRLKPLHFTEIWKDEPSVPFLDPEDEQEETAVNDVNGLASIPEEVIERTAPPITEPNCVVPVPPNLFQTETVQTTDSSPRPVPELPPRRAGLRPRELLNKLKSNKYPATDYLLDSDDSD